MNRAINEPKSLHLLNEIVAIDLLSSEAKTPQFKMFLKVHKEGNPAKPVVSSTIAILQRFQDILITSYSHM